MKPKVDKCTACNQATDRPDQWICSYCDKKFKQIEEFTK